MFLLIRHAAHIHLNGTLTGRLDGVPLSEAGRTQARDLAERLGGEAIDHVVTSPRERARDTAAAIARVARAEEPEIDAAFDEIDFGDWTGRRFAELDADAAWDRWNAARSTGTPPNGEAATAAQGRALAGLRRLAAKHEGGIVAVVTHCDVIRSVVCAVLGLSLDHLLRFDIDAASVTRLTLGAEGGVLHCLNERTA
jgi:broad specificity phosphatase PhoE